MQQPVRKMVGRFPAGSNPLRRLEQLNAFIFTFSKNELPAGEHYPFEKLLVALVMDSVDFATVGGVAVIMNGYVRATEDADIIVSDTPENLCKLLQSLEQWAKVSRAKADRHDSADKISRGNERTNPSFSPISCAASVVVCFILWFFTLLNRATLVV